MASINTLQNAVNGKNFENISLRLYGFTPFFNTRKRFLELLSEHTARYAAKEALFFSSPGRIEIAGNHTDHNLGKVVAAAISIDTLAVVTKTDNGVIRVSSAGFKDCVVNTAAIGEPDKSGYGDAASIIRGVCRYFADNGLKVGGFDATTVSNVFKGAGVSSSSAFELLIAEILNVLYNDSKIDNLTKAIASRYAENVYFGKPSGLMDQTAIALGGINMIDFESEIPTYRHMTWNFQNLDIYIVNTGGDHSDLTPDYAAIRKEMNSVAEFLGKKVLREVDAKEFWKAMPELKEKLSGRAVLRALHFFEENARVEKLERAVESVDEALFLSMISASGLSSQTLLQNLHSPKDALQPVDLGVELTKRVQGVKAVRVHGGGFAGTILAFVDKRYSKNYYGYVKSIFGEKNVFNVSIRNDGATLLPLW
ncbi:MAG: galactokinase [Clostridiaceae bacterium]|jgi:galactokinase|nr:galactokinase [Clostridiaceae bacterium]